MQHFIDRQVLNLLMDSVIAGTVTQFLHQDL
jgi:hypothetical protein